MIGILAQITTTFIALSLTLLAGYVIFLSTSRANIDAEIQAEGAKIVNELRASATFEIPLPYMDFFLLQSYQAKHPDLARPALLYRIAFDLVTKLIFQKEEKEIFDVAAKGNAPGNLGGRIALWVVQQSVATLLPREVPWPGQPAVRTFGQIPDVSTIPQESLFPSGPLGAEDWVRQFRQVRQTVSLISDAINKDILLADLEQFLKDPPDFYKRLRSLDYRSWLAKMQATTEALTTHADRISSLFRLKDTLTIKSRLPNLAWVALLGGILLFVGVILPLTLVGLRLEEAVPPAVNMAIMITVLASSLATVFLLGRDMTKSSDQSFSEIRYLMPLRDQTLSDDKKGYSEVTFSLDLLSRLLTDADKLGLSKKDIRLLEAYRDAIRVSNSASEQTASQLALQFRSSSVLAKYRAAPGAGGSSLAILATLDSKKDQTKTDVELQAGTNIIIQDVRGHVTTDVLALELPKNPEQLKEIRQAITGIYDLYRSSETYKTFVKARTDLDRARKSVLGWLQQKIKPQS